MTPKKVLLVGSWHLGSVVGACLAEAGHEVHLWDQRSSVAEKWKAGTPPIFEPGLEELAAKSWQRNLFWASSLDAIARTADWIIFAYDTPINEQDEVQLEIVEEGLRAVQAPGFSAHADFLFTSQLPVGTCRRFRAELARGNPDWRGQVLYQPENLRLGDALNSFKSPDRVVLGLEAADSDDKARLEAAFRELTGVKAAPLDTMSLESAEMVKHALNTFLAMCVVFGNEVAEVCEQTGADAWDVMASLKKDSRVGPKSPVYPGLGFAGGTLARDVKTLSKLHRKTSNENFFSRLYGINQQRNEWVVSALRSELKDLAGKRVVLLGVTYKPFTSTVRRSPAIDIARLLHEAGAISVALDPMADLDELSPAERKGLPLHLLKDPGEAFREADAAVLITEWPQFLEWDWPALKAGMRSTLLIDTKRFLTKVAVAAGLRSIVPGKPREVRR